MATADDAKRAVRALLRRLDESTEDCLTAADADFACHCQGEYDAVLRALDALADAVAVYADGHNEASRALGRVAAMGEGHADIT